MKVCFVVPSAWQGLISSERKVSGGAEVQIVMLAREMVVQGVEVSFVVYDEGQSEVENIGGMKVYKMFKTESGIPGLRNWLYRRPMLVKAMKAADADIYVQVGAGQLTGIVSKFCKKNQCRFVFFSSSDSNFDPSEWHRSFSVPFRDVRMYKQGLKNSDLIIVQHKGQKDMLKELFDMNCVIIKGSILVLENGNYGNSEKGAIIRIGRYHPVKRVEIFFDLAERLPQFKFISIGGASSDKKYYNNLLERSKNLPNLEHLGHVKSIKDYLSNAALLVNTSKQEGFPVTFLEAWLKEVPVLSLAVNPEECITAYNMGRVSWSFDKLVTDCEELLNNPQELQEMGKQGFDYVKENHDVRRVAALVIKNIKNLIAKYEAIQAKS